MNYECGTNVMLGDEIMVGYGPNARALARVLAVGTDEAVDDIDPEFYSWAESDPNVLGPDTVVVTWLDTLDPNDPPLGSKERYLVLSSICCERFV